MQRRRHRIVVLDCPFFAWRLQRYQELRFRAQNPPVEKPVALPFTFSDVPPALAGGECSVVLKPSQGVKS